MDRQSGIEPQIYTDEHRSNPCASVMRACVAAASPPTTRAAAMDRRSGIEPQIYTDEHRSNPCSSVMRACLAAASPPDVRRGSAPPYKSQQGWAEPLAGPLAHKLWGRARTRGIAPFESGIMRRGEAPPHIRRRSRSDGVQSSLAFRSGFEFQGSSSFEFQSSFRVSGFKVVFKFQSCFESQSGFGFQ